MSISHYDWKNRRQTCPACGWSGLGEEAEMGESFAGGAEYHCPRCDHYFCYVPYPLLSVSLGDLRAPEANRMVAEVVMRRVRQPNQNDPHA